MDDVFFVFVGVENGIVEVETSRMKTFCGFVLFASAWSLAAGELPGIVVDSSQARAVGEWTFTHGKHSIF